MRLKIFAYNEVHDCVSMTCDHAQVLSTHTHNSLFVIVTVCVCVAT